MKYKSIVGAVAVAAVILTLGLAGCCGDSNPSNNDGRGEPPPPTTSDMDIFVVDVSKETDDWNYMVAAKDGSSMFIDVDESTDMPSRMFIKPDKSSNEGATIFFKENGLPDKLVVDGHILYFGNFNGYKYDLAIIYPDDRIEYHYDIETDVNWDDYSDTVSGLFKVSSTGNVFNILKHLTPLLLPTITCGVTIFVPNPVTAAMCASGVIGLVAKTAVETVFDGFTEDAGKALVDVMLCASGSWGSCASGLINSASLLSHLDFNFTEQKNKQIDEANGNIGGGGNPSVTTYTITFNANGGTVSPTSGKTGTGGRLTSLPTPTRSGWTFDGWYTAQKGGVEVTTSRAYSANATIYARWTDNSVTSPRTEKGNNIANYKTVTIGSQTWMAENLDYEVQGSKCYGEDGFVTNRNVTEFTQSILLGAEVQENCSKYGRLYTYRMALNGASGLVGNISRVQGVCPAG